MQKPIFNKLPYILCSKSNDDISIGWKIISDNIKSENNRKKTNVITIECYQGIFYEEILNRIQSHFIDISIIETKDLLLPSSTIEEMVKNDLTDDPTFGKITEKKLSEFFDLNKLEIIKQKIKSQQNSKFIIFGTGASLIEENALLVYFDMPRWEIIQRMRNNLVDNLFVSNKSESHKLQYKRAFFLDWRLLDKYKTNLFDKIDFIVDSVDTKKPKMISGKIFRESLNKSVSQPFELVPFFDPGPWGGQWMKEKFGLDNKVDNFAWCFNCVPEENSLLLKFGNTIFETPSLNLVLYNPKELLGESVYKIFGAEFPIRFDYLDTIEGGNLSLQVHPTTDYIKDNFRMNYTQDESYYLLAVKEDASVYLGLKENVNKDELINELNNAQNDGSSFNTEKFINKLPAKKHDHFLIPAGTIHCSGKNCLVLEISSTPYIFTFKLWDWDRLDLDGTPRPINIEHGKNVINWKRDTNWVKNNLVNRFETISENGKYREEKTGLHKLEFIETRRHWFTESVMHNTEGTVNVLNLVEGDQVIVESPTNSFDPIVVNYAETFVIPASVGKYKISPYGESLGKECATIKAFVRN